MERSLVGSALRWVSAPKAAVRWWLLAPGWLSPLFAQVSLHFKVEIVWAHQSN